MDSLEKYAPKKHNRKKENIELLEYLLKEFQTNSSNLEDIYDLWSQPEINTQRR